MTEFEAALHEATNNENKMLEASSLRNLARQTRIRENLEITVKHLFAKYQEPREKWRKTLKALIFTKYILEAGNERFWKELNRQRFLVESLVDKYKREPAGDNGQSELTSFQRSEGDSETYRYGADEGGNGGATLAWLEKQQRSDV